MTDGRKSLFLPSPLHCFFVLGCKLLLLTFLSFDSSESLQPLKLQKMT